MSKKKGRQAERTDAAVKKKTEQEEVLSEKKGLNRSFSGDDPKAPMTIVLHDSTRRKIKLYAVANGTTVSSLIEDWIAEHCKGV